MSALTGWALRSRAVTIFLMLVVLAVGVFAYQSLRQDMYPEVDYPFVIVVTFYPSASPETVERDVTEEIEKVVRGLSGVKHVQSTSAASQSIVMVEFEFGEDMKEAERSVQSSVNGVTLPAEVKDPLVQRVGSETIPVMMLGVTWGRDLMALQKIVDDQMVPQIEQVDGVRRVELIGKVDEEVQVTVDTDKLEDLGLTLSQVSAALVRNNRNMPAGDINHQGQSFPVMTMNRLSSLEDVRNVVIAYEGIPGSGGERRPIRVRDVAEVGLSTPRASAIWRTDGKPGVGVHVFSNPDYSKREVTSSVREVVERMDGLPIGLEVAIMGDVGKDARGQLRSLSRDGTLGFLLAILVVFLFLLNLRPSWLRGTVLTLRPTLVIAISIPLSILLGLLFLSLAGQTLNQMTIAGLAIAVGRLVDDSIVVLENIYAHLQRGEEKPQAAYQATREVAGAIVGTTLATIVAFVPLAFIPGLVSSYFTPMVMALSFALLGSTLVALTAVPVLCAMLLHRGEDSTGGEATLAGAQEQETWLQRIYTPALMLALRYRIATLLLVAVITVASLGLTWLIPVRLFPTGSPDYLTIDLDLPTGASVERTFAEVLKIEEVLAGLKGSGIVEHYQASIGSAQDVFGIPGGKVVGLDFASFIVRLGEDAPEDIVQRLRAELPGNDEVTISTSGVRVDSPPESDLVINVSGKDFAAVSRVARQLEAGLKDVDGLVNVTSDVAELRDEIVVRGHPEELARWGLDAGQVGLQVYQFVTGQPITEVDWDGKAVDLVVRGRPEDVADIESIRNLNIQALSSSGASQVKLGSIAGVAIEPGPVSISRFDGERSATITGTLIAEDTRAVGRQVQARIDALELLPGVEIRTLGIFQDISEAFQDIALANLTGVVLVYVLLVVIMGSIRNPVVILTSLPLAAVGALVALTVTGRALSISSLMGVLLLIGVVLANAIVLITFIQQLRARGASIHDAVVQGGRARVRPITMTALTTIIALVPLATALAGQGGSVIGAGLATVVIGGLVSSTFLTLIVVPLVYTMYHDNVPRYAEASRSAAVACCVYCYDRCRALLGRLPERES